MGVSMHRASAPAFAHGMRVLSALIDKAEAHARETGIDPKTLVEGRLAPDMLTLAGQVQRASDTAKASVERLSGVKAPAFADEETTLAELRERCARTIAFLGSVPPGAFEGSESREITMFGPKNPKIYRGDDYLLEFGLPNFYFHVTTAYDILRHLGVAVGKRDFLAI